MNQSPYVFCCGGVVPHLGERIELGVRCDPVKVLHIRRKLFAGTEMQSISV